MNKKVFFFWSICLLAIVPLLVGCEKDDEVGDLIIVESFEGTDGMEGERILYDLEEVSAVIVQDDTFEEYVIFGLEETWKYSNVIPSLIGISKKEFAAYDFPIQTKIWVSLSITNVERHTESNTFPIDYSVGTVRKAYLKEIKVY